MVTIKQIEAFYAVAQKKGVRPAALELNATESAISKRLQELEDSLRVELFNRDRRSLQLTGVGAEILSLSARLLETRRQIEAVASAHDGAPRTLRFGMTELVASLFLPKMVDRLRRDLPMMRLIPTIGLTGDLHDQISNNELDILIAPARNPDADIVFEPTFISRPIWVCSPTFEIGPGDLTISLLSQHPIIIQPSASRLHRNVMQWFSEHGTRAETIIPCNNLPGLKDLARAGVGIAPLPLPYCEHEIANAELVELQIERSLPHIQYGTIYRRNAAFRRVKEIADLFQSICILA